MPQFNLANFVPQLAWLAVFFAILYFGIVKLTLPKLGKVMNEREHKVGADIAGAEQAKQQADEIARQYEASIAEAQANARSAVSAAKAEVSRSVEKRLSALAATLGERQQQAEAELAEARSKAMAEIETVAAEAAAEIVTLRTGKRPAETETVAAASKALESA